MNRRLNWKIRVENDNKNQKLIKKEWIWKLVEVIVEELERDIIEKYWSIKSGK